LLMGMRINAGVSLSRYVEITGQALSETVLLELIDLRMIEISGDQLRTTVQGRPVLNAILDRLLLDQ
jgi:oxygen-independent coproporphyrinogen-3 oxidase